LDPDARAEKAIKKREYHAEITLHLGHIGSNDSLCEGSEVGAAVSAEWREVEPERE